METDITDKMLRKLAENEKLEIPDSARRKIERTLDSLPEGKVKRLDRGWVKVMCSAAAVIIAVFIALPNMNAGICSAMSDIPVIGGLIKVVTFREYKYESENLRANVNMPALEAEENDGEEIKLVIDRINEEVAGITDEMVAQIEQWREETELEAHIAVSERYDIIRDDDEWFTLMVEFWLGAGSSDTVYKYYNIDKSAKSLVTLDDLFESDGYLLAITEEVTRQMKLQMEKDDSAQYWLDDPFAPFTEIRRDANFYFSEAGNIVLVFEKYEVGPGCMGCPEFEIPRSVYSEYLKSEY